MPASVSSFLDSSCETWQGTGPSPTPVRRLFAGECETVGRLQRTAFGGRAHVPVAIDDAGSCREGRILAHARIALGYAGRPPPVRFVRGGHAAKGRFHRLPAWGHASRGPTRAGSRQL